jgi:hypothetical protein
LIIWWLLEVVLVVAGVSILQMQEAAAQVVLEPVLHLL